MGTSTLASLILVADDDRAVRFTICQILEDSGFRTIEAADGEEALARCRDFDTLVLVVLDLDMPKTNGFAFLQRAETLDGIPPVVVVSASSDETTRDRVSALGASALVGKPFEPADLVDAARRAIGSFDLEVA